MKTRLRRLWERIRESYWFVPALMSGGAVILATFMIRVDTLLSEKIIAGWTMIYTGGPEGARELLGTVAASVITVGGVVFSITIVALQLASSQFGPRLLRNYLRDVVNQVSMGTFVATFLYSLLVLRAVRTGDGTAGSVFIPHLSVTISILLMVISLGVLIFYIHHIAGSIQAPNVIGSVAEELDEAMELLFPRKIGQPPRANEPQEGEHYSLPEGFADDARDFAVSTSGYLQAVIFEDLMDLMVRHDLQAELLRRPGHFVTRGQPLIRIAPADRVNEKVDRDLHKVFIIGGQRTLTQDAEFGIDQFVEMAVRALSPGINDPFTAMNCIDRIGAALSRVANRHFPSPYRLDDGRRLRVVAHPYDFRGFVGASFHQIRQNASGVVAVVIRMLEAIQTVAGRAHFADDLEALRDHAQLIHRAGLSTCRDPADQADIEERYLETSATIDRQLAEVTDRRGR